MIFAILLAPGDGATASPFSAIIAIAPVGSVEPGAIARLVPLLRDAFRSEVVMAPPLPLPGRGWNAHRRQHLSTAILDELARARRPEWGGLATLLLDLLTSAEEEVDEQTAHLRFDIGFLAKRLLGAARWLRQDADGSRLQFGYFGASTGAAAALVAAAEGPDLVQAIVSRGGRPDLAGQALASVRAPTLLIVGGLDVPVIALNCQAFAELGRRVAGLNAPAHPVPVRFTSRIPSSRFHSS